MAEIIDEYKKCNIIVGGDFNARTADKGGKIEGFEEKEERRKVKDVIMNDEGKKLLRWLSENGMGIINGNTEGDEEGEYTYISTVGKSTEDYIANKVGEEKLARLEVGICDTSDHMPIQTELDTKIEVEGEKKEEEIEIVKWQEQDKRKYIERLQESGKAIEWKDLKRKMCNAMIRKKVKRNKNKIIWWDNERSQEKEKFLEEIVKYKKDEISKEIYKEKKKNIQKLFERKKRKK